ncbi:MAG: hypothetical protein WCC97_02000 [Candidatus Acidiferrales bacterium]
MNKRDVLGAITFGHRIAEDEVDTLISYFVETDQWRKVVSGQVDIVYGPKGSGKSALYSLLRKRRDELFARGIILAPCESVRGTPVFEDLVIDPPASEEQFRGLWKLYFLALIGTAFQIAKIETPHAQELLSALESAHLVESEWSLKRSLRSALDYVRRIDSMSGGVKVSPSTGQPEGLEAKVTLREPGAEERKRGYVSADTLLETTDKALEEAKMTFWLVLDRLDVSFADSPDLEGNALRALFRVYRDMAALKHVSLKIFLRDDIWARIVSAGFREASHITQSITITWDARSLLHLVIRRALHNEAIRKYYNVDSAAVLASAEEQEKLFYRIFPAQVDLGERKSTTLDWMLTRVADGTDNTAPRELVHLLSAARDQQLKQLEMGASEPAGEALFDRSALKAALPEVSRVRYEQTLCAEHPTLKAMLDKLEGEKTQQTPATLAKIWHMSEADAHATAEQLAEVGFFQRRGSKEQPLFWVPFLYRDALNLVQGQAEQ